ncbi:MAG: VWA domain-containing protein, partial [Chloroflexus sp.]|nr:VWA domain-containing protein [Chloroflexus sp.]
MTLLAPLALLSLLTLPIIVVLHMMQSRRRRVEVPSLLLWRQIPLQATARRRRRLRLTLLLLLHLLVASLIGVALAQPEITLPWTNARTRAIIIDTSTSMALVEGTSSRLERARQRAAVLIREMRSADQVALISAGPRPRLIDRGKVADSARLLGTLTTLDVEGSGSDLVSAFTIAETLLLDQPGAEIFVLTDGALPPPNVSNIRFPVHIEVIGTEQPNRAVATLAARTDAAQAIHIYARLVNAGNRLFRGPVQLWLDDQLQLTEQVSMQAGAVLELSWTLRGPSQQVRLELDGADGLPLDDTATVMVNNRRPIRVLLVADNSPALMRALQAMPEVEVTTVSPTDYVLEQSATVEVTILVDTLPARWPTGGVLVINPPAGSLLDVRGTTAAVPTITLTPAGETLLRDINLGGIDWGSITIIEPPDWLTPLAFSGTQPLILRGRVERSDITVWNVDLTDHPLTRRLAFPLLVARTMRSLAPPPLPAAVTAGETLLYQADLRTT